MRAAPKAASACPPEPPVRTGIAPMSDSSGIPAPVASDRRFRPAAHVRAGADFKRCFALGKRAAGTAFSLSFREHDASDCAAGITMPRLGLAVSRKVDKRAVERNRLRRLIREWFRHRQHGLRGGDLVVVGKPAARGLDPSRIFAELDAIARRLGLPCAPTASKMRGPRASPQGDDA